MRTLAAAILIVLLASPVFAQQSSQQPGQPAGQQPVKIERAPGERIHTTGLVVKEAAERWEIPSALTRRVHGIRLYSPSLRTLDLASSGYYFLATDTAALMRWLTREAARSGAHVRFGRPYRAGDGAGAARYLVGADGPRSGVAREFGLGTNRRFLVGVGGPGEQSRQGERAQAERSTQEQPAQPDRHAYSNVGALPRRGRRAR